jgi:hypothetical protein
MTRTPLLALLFAAGLPAQDPSPPAPLPTPSFRGIFVADADSDGAFRIRGERYKLGLSGAGAAYQPLFGPRAPRDYPLQFRLLGAEVGHEPLPLASPAADRRWQRDGERFAFDHGALRECWHVTPTAAQQYFEVAQPTGKGDLVLRIAATGDLRLVDDGPGVRFEAPGLGHVHYSDAVVFDATGERIDVPVVAVRGELTITVPASFTAAAAWPLVVDPLVTTVAIDTTVSDVQDPRVACNPTSGTWLVVAEEHVSATDVDIVCHRYTDAVPPVLLETVYAESGPDFAHNPGLGFLAQPQQFVVAWHNATAGNFQWRTRTATSTAMGTVLNTSAGIGGNLDNRPLIGSTLAGDRFLLVMFRKNTTGTDILAVLLRNTGTNFGTLFIGPLLAPSQGTAAPGGVSVAENFADKWVVVWRECTDALCGTQLVRMQAIVSNNGVGPLTGEPTVTLASGPLVDEPDVAGHGGHLLAVWRTFDGTTNSNDIHGVPIAATGGVYAPQGAVQNLSAQEPGVANVREQFRPSVSYDHCRFVYGYLEDNGNDLVFPHAATVFVDGASIAWHEGHLPLSTVPGLTCRSFDLGYGSSAQPGLHWAVYQQDSPTFTGDVRGAVIDARQPGLTNVVTQTGCGLPSEPGLGLTGTPAIGRTFTIAMNAPGAFPMLLAGADSTSALPGCGACQLGVVQATMLVFIQPSLAVAVPCDAGMLGLRLAFQGLAAFQTGGCPAAFAGFEFAVSDTITIQVR